LKEHRACPFKGKERVEFSKWPASQKIILEHVIGSDISDKDALMYVVLSKAESHMPYWELAGTTEYLTL